MYRKRLQLPPTPATHTHTHTDVCEATGSTQLDVTHHLSHTSHLFNFVLYRWPDDLNVYCCPFNSDVCHHLSNKMPSCWEEQSALVVSSSRWHLPFPNFRRAGGNFTFRLPFSFCQHSGQRLESFLPPQIWRVFFKGLFWAVWQQQRVTGKVGRETERGREREWVRDDMQQRFPGGLRLGNRGYVAHILLAAAPPRHFLRLTCLPRVQTAYALPLAGTMSFESCKIKAALFRIYLKKLGKSCWTANSICQFSLSASRKKPNQKPTVCKSLHHSQLI